MASIAGSRATTNYYNDTKANQDTAKVTTTKTKKKISDADKKKIREEAESYIRELMKIL